MFVNIVFCRAARLNNRSTILTWKSFMIVFESIWLLAVPLSTAGASQRCCGIDSVFIATGPNVSPGLNSDFFGYFLLESLLGVAISTPLAACRFVFDALQAGLKGGSDVDADISQILDDLLLWYAFIINYSCLFFL